MRAFLLLIGSLLLSASALAQPRTESGALAAGDETLSSGEYADEYTVEVGAGQALTADLRSADFDTYLIAIAPSGAQVDNDDWEDNLDWSRVEVADAEAGTWRILVTSYEVGETGAYTLALSKINAFGSASAGARAVTVCLLDDTDLVEWDALYHPDTGHTEVDGRLLSAGGYEYEDWVYERGRYAEGTPWYINNDPIEIGGATYVRFGLPRVLGVYEVTFLDEVNGAAVFVEPGMDDAPEIVYVAVRPGCEFQPYQREIE